MSAYAVDPRAFAESGRSVGFKNGLLKSGLNIEGLKSSGAFKPYLLEPTKANALVTYGDLLGSLIRAGIVMQAEIDIISGLSDEEAKEYILSLSKLIQSGVAPDKAKALAYAAAKDPSITLDQVKGSFERNAVKPGSEIEKLFTAYGEDPAQFTTANVDAFLALRTLSTASAINANTAYTAYVGNQANLYEGFKAIIVAKKAMVDTLPPPAASPAAAETVDAMSRFLIGLNGTAAEQLHTTLKANLADGLNAAEKVALKRQLTDLGLTGAAADALLARLEDGKITKNELTALRAQGINISDVLFDLIANQMRADKTADQEISLDDLIFATQVIAERAAILEMEPEAMAKAYVKANSFVNVTNEALKGAKARIVGNLSTANYYKITIPSSITDPNLKAAYLLRCAMAKLTGLFNIFGINETDLASMDNFQPGAVTADNIDEWLRTGRVEEVATGTSKDKEIREIDDYIREKRITAAESSAIRYLEKLIKEGKIGEAEAFLAKYDVKGKIPGLANTTQVALAFFYYYIDTAKGNDLAKAVEYANKLPLETRTEVYDRAVEARRVKIEGLLNTDLPNAQTELTSLGAFIKKMGTDGNKYNAVLYQLTVKAAIRLAGSGGTTAAYALIETLPESGFEVKHGDYTYDQRTLSSQFEALIYVASEAGDLAKINELLTAERTKTPPNPINIALALEARASVLTKKALTAPPKPKDRKADTPQKLRKKAFQDLKEARSTLAGNSSPKASEIAARLDRSAKQLIEELVNVLSQEARTKKVTNLMQEWSGTAAAGSGGSGGAVP